jgi:hypothetical protein
MSEDYTMIAITKKTKNKLFDLSKRLNLTQLETLENLLSGEIHLKELK